MLPDSTQQLILKLWDLTQRGVIPWQSGEEGEQRFETEGYVVAIRGQPARVRILRPNGHTVEETDAAALSETSWPQPDHARFDGAVSALAHQAAKVASGEVKAVRAVMSALSAPAKNPAPKPPPTVSDTASEKPIFGAINSFDISGKRRAPAEMIDRPASPISPAPEKNVYSPWIS